MTRGIVGKLCYPIAAIVGLKPSASLASVLSCTIMSGLPMALAYEDRLIAFIDILGFGALVQSSAAQPELVKRISDALGAAEPAVLRNRMFGEVNEHLVPQSELAEVREMGRLFADAIASQHEVRLSFFSDSLVMSASASDVLATQTIVDLVGRLQLTFWMEHKLLLRGGITMGPLHHVQRGQLFGPSMNEAYRLESKVANYPRVVIDGASYAALKAVPTWQVLDPFFEHDDVIGMSLAGCYEQLLAHAPLSMNDEVRWLALQASLRTATDDLKAIRDTMTDERIISKYEWLIPRIEDARLRLGNRHFGAPAP